MSYYPPVGDELTACKKLNRLAKKVNIIEDEFGYLADSFSGNNFSWGIEASFILEGVRTNGHEFPHTIAAWMLYLESIKKTWPETKKKMAKQISKFDNVLLTVEKHCQNFELCNTCHGTCGEKVTRDVHSNVYDWVDCDSCQGRGVVGRPPPDMISVDYLEKKLGV